MQLKNFEEWFAIRPGHSDDGEHLPGRLFFDLDEGIQIDTIRFSQTEKDEARPLVRGQTMTGWLDYQRPATVIQPWVQQTGGLTFSMDTPALRESQRFIGSSILKNVFLEDLTQAIFTGIVVEHPAFHAWVNPHLVASEWSVPEDIGLPCLSVDVRPPTERVFTLSDGTQARINSATRVPRGQATTLEEYSVLSLRFPEPITYERVVRLTWSISALFEFLISARVQAPVYQLPTTFKRAWNREEREVIAELWYIPVSRKGRLDSIPNLHNRLTFEKRSPVSLETLLNHAIGSSDELIYLADLVQSAEDHDLPLTQGFGELLGCLEAFDDRTFGSGADENFKTKMKDLSELIETHGTDENKDLFARIKGNTPNKFSLLKRLERLHKVWQEDEFRGDPRLSRIRDLRNIIPHGRGLEISGDIAQEMITYLQYLTALGRYHVLKKLGFTGTEVAAAFSWQPHRYGMFVPERMIPKRSHQEDVEAQTE